MEKDRFEETTEAFNSRRPFRPFTMLMVDGDRLEVDHPRALHYRDGTAVLLGSGGVPVIFDHESVSQVIGDLASAGMTH